MDLECNIPEDFDKAKGIIKDDACMIFYDEAKPLYIEKDVSGVGLGAAPYKQEPIQAVIEMKCWTIACLGPLHSPAKSLMGKKRDTAILKE